MMCVYYTKIILSQMLEEMVSAASSEPWQTFGKSREARGFLVKTIPDISVLSAERELKTLTFSTETICGVISVVPRWIKRTSN